MKRKRKRTIARKYKIRLIIILLILFTIGFIINKYDKKETQESSSPIENETNTSISEDELANQTEDNNNQTNNDDNNNENNIQEDTEAPKKEIDSSTTDWNLILVNKNNSIPDDYSVDLSKVEDNHKVDSRIAESLKNMLKDARSEGIYPRICSSYRTNKEQTQLYNNKINQYLTQGYNKDKAKELASYWVTIPNASEHETGLAVDIISNAYQKLDKNQENTEVQKWLKENSYKYGFTVRYPPNKSEITMINYEPWHYRYVGIENAKYMKEHNMCLEEYIDYLSQFED